VKRLAGFRTRTSDLVTFVELDEAIDYEPANWKEVICPDQLVRVGNGPSEPSTDEPYQPGEWGRLGPPTSTSGASDVTTIAAQEPLSKEDASARATIGINLLPGSQRNAGPQDDQT